MLSLVFLLAGLAGLYRAFVDPEDFISRINLTPGSWALRVFLGHASAAVAVIGVVQLGIAFLISLRGRAVHIGLVSGILFLLGVVPLDAVRGFSIRVLFSLTAVLLLRFSYTTTLATKLAGLFGNHQHASRVCWKWQTKPRHLTYRANVFDCVPIGSCRLPGLTANTLRLREIATEHREDHSFEPGFIHPAEGIFFCVLAQKPSQA